MNVDVDLVVFGCCLIACNCEHERTSACVVRLCVCLCVCVAIVVCGRVVVCVALIIRRSLGCLRVRCLCVVRVALCVSVCD